MGRPKWHIIDEESKKKKANFCLMANTTLEEFESDLDEEVNLDDP